MAPKATGYDPVTGTSTVRAVVTPGTAASVTVPAAITGGEAPTEAEHNALRLAVANLKAELVTAGVLA